MEKARQEDVSLLVQFVCHLALRSMQAQYHDWLVRALTLCCLHVILGGFMPLTILVVLDNEKAHCSWSNVLVGEDNFPFKIRGKYIKLFHSHGMLLWYDYFRWGKTSCRRE